MGAEFFEKWKRARRFFRVWRDFQNVASGKRNALFVTPIEGISCPPFAL